MTDYFADIRALADQAVAGALIHGVVNEPQGWRLHTLLESERQHREAHAHSQQLRSEAEQEGARLTLALQDIADELLQLEQHCPCGARPETPATHPHVSGCHVAAALAHWETLRVDA